MMNFDPFGQHDELRRMRAEHEQMLRGVQNRRKSYRPLIGAILLINILGFALLVYVGYKFLTHFGIL